MTTHRYKIVDCKQITIASKTSIAVSIDSAVAGNQHQVNLPFYIAYKLTIMRVKEKTDSLIEAILGVNTITIYALPDTELHHVIEHNWGKVDIYIDGNYSSIRCSNEYRLMHPFTEDEIIL